VDDHLPFRAVLAETVASLKHDVFEAGSGEEALELLKTVAPDVVFLDLRLPDIGGLEVLQKIRESPVHKDVPVVILTAYADSTNTIEAMRLGAFDHITKPICREELKQVIARAIGSTTLGDRAANINGNSPPDRLIGASAAFRDVEKMIGLALSTSTPVVLLGETGTGKEQIARTIHQHSERQEEPFLLIPCSAPQEGFGRWEQQGAVYLEELSDLEPASQAQLLGLLREDSSGPRVISSSCHDLVGLARQGGFREDLYYRLCVFPIHVPPLRNRGSDILVLAEAFLNRACPEKPKRLTPAAAKALLEYSWPGNVRELQNMTQTSSIVARGFVIDHQDLAFAQGTSSPEITLTDLLQLDYYSAVARLEKILLEKALKDAAGNRTEAARSLGINRQLLYSKLKEHGVE